MLNGKSIFSWNIPAVAGGDPDGFTQYLLDHNFEGVCLKCADGTRVQVPSPYSPWPDWGDNIRPELVYTLKAAGIKVYFWQFVYGFNPLGEVDVASLQIDNFKPDGYIWNVEGSFDSKLNAVENARILSEGLRNIYPDLDQGLCWWALPKSPETGTEWHPIKVAEEFLKVVNVGMPMMYWQGRGASAAVSYLNRSLSVWRDFTDVPLIPIGRAYNGDGGYADGPGIEAFSTQVFSRAESDGIIGNSWYSLDKARLNPYWMEALYNAPMFNVNEAPEVPLEERVAAVEAAIQLHSVKLVDLERRVTALEDDNTLPDPEPPIEPGYVKVEITNSHKPQYFSEWDKSCGENNRGKPTFLPKDHLPKMRSGEVYECFNMLAWSCHDDPNTPEIFGAGMAPHYRIATGEYAGSFIRANSSRIIK